MNGVVFDEAKTIINDNTLSAGPFSTGDVQVMLFDTLTALGHGNVLADLEAHEVTFTGYARQPITTWGSSGLTADFHARSQGDTVTFTSTDVSDSSTITGWALVDNANGVVLQAGLYDTPFVIAAGQGYITTPFWLYTGEVSSEG